MHLIDKVAIVTGAGSGIGRAIAAVELIRDDALAGRVMLYYEGEERRLVPVETEV